MWATTSNLRKPILVIVAVGCFGKPVEAQRAREWQAQGLATFSATRFVGGGLGYALRTRGRLRIGLSLSGGDLEGSLGGRGEATLTYHLFPARRRGLTPYAGGGAAVAATRDASAEYIVVLFGVESNPGRGSGWFAEAGVGGGVRVSAGVRLRRRSAAR